jgi:hypothetical protein
VSVPEELLGVERVADCDTLGDAEHAGQPERIAAAGEGFFELPVDAQPFERGGLAAQVQDPGGANRTAPRTDPARIRPPARCVLHES